MACLRSGQCLRSHQSLLQIANKELLEKRIPFTIRRYLPDGRWGSSCAAGCSEGRGHADGWALCSYEDWSVKELILTDR